MSKTALSAEERRARLLAIMRAMDCQDLFDDAFYALVQYERALNAARSQPMTGRWDNEIGSSSPESVRPEHDSHYTAGIGSGS